MWSMTRAKPIRCSRTSIHSLPNEILAEIFIAGSSTSLEASGSGRGRTAVLFTCRVASVDRHWRDLALNLPVIWTTIIISDQRPLTLPARFITRSGNLPLRVITCLESNEDNKRIVPTVRLLLVCVPRMRSLVLRVNFMTLSRTCFLRLFDAIAPALEHLDIEMLDEDLDSWEDHVMGDALRCFLAKGAYRLSSLHLRGDLLHASPQWFTVTTLDLTLEPCLRPRAWNSFSDLLASCPILKTLVLRGGSFPIPHADVPELDILHGSLRTIALDCRTDMRKPVEIALFLTHLKIPSLKYLELFGVSGDTLEAWAAFSKSRTHISWWSDDPPSYLELNTLRLVCFVPGEHAPSTDFFDLFPALHHLELIRSKPTHFFPLSPPSCSSGHCDAPALPHSHSFWPSLRTLTYDGKDYSWLYDTVQSRQRLGRALSHLRIIDAFYQPLQLKLLKDLVVVERLVNCDSGYISLHVETDDSLVVSDKWSARAMWCLFLPLAFLILSY
ncbi:hypothetical protein BV22DRAFT_263651 [Leucogyrophana mollusca]|uniref:Uncharacterized protein n=1 Tax=Leucogyrophana mollusca TaxID=85980 RepID=A0ACB8BP29_9AGAM|nr:hypothetical protein BV22DRAFT_263651 [Leucogyrophana mollusca]